MQEEINKAINNIANLICGFNSQSSKELVRLFQEKVKIEFVDSNNNLENTNFSGGTKGTIIHKFDNNQLKVQNTNIVVTFFKNLPINNYTKVDIHHELFHAFTKLMMGIKNAEKKDNNTYLIPAGGKISTFIYENGLLKNNGDVPFFLLVNELMTDLFAYICTYQSMEGIIYSDDLISIKNNYGYKNGYFELLPLGLVIFNAFANYTPDYDKIYNSSSGVFDKKYLSDNKIIYYNDLLYGIMFNPLYIKNKLLEGLTEDEYNELNRLSSMIINNFQNGSRTIKQEEIIKVLEIIKKYFVNKMDKIEEDITNEEILYDLFDKFNQRYNSSINYYNSSINIRQR